MDTWNIPTSYDLGYYRLQGVITNVKGKPAVYIFAVGVKDPVKDLVLYTSRTVALDKTANEFKCSLQKEPTTTTKGTASYTRLIKEVGEPKDFHWNESDQIKREAMKVTQYLIDAQKSRCESGKPYVFKLAELDAKNALSKATRYVDGNYGLNYILDKGRLLFEKPKQGQMNAQTVYIVAVGKKGKIKDTIWRRSVMSYEEKGKRECFEGGFAEEEPGSGSTYESPLEEAGPLKPLN